MANYLNNNPAVQAIIKLKNGTRKYGMLVDNSLFRSDAFHFICNTKFELFKATNSPEFIEIVPGGMVASIETDLK